MSQLIDPEALKQLEKWLGEAKAAMVPEYNAMTLSTAVDGRVSARTVLLKALDAEGLVFFTNTSSRKGQQLAANPSVALTFFWMPLYRQILVEGRCLAVTSEEADAYWETRDRISQIGAWASDQSSRLTHRDQLLDRVKQFEQKFADQAVPRPPHWSGYRVQPDRIEFWAGKDHRLHDRSCYTLEHDQWHQAFLYP